MGFIFGGNTGVSYEEMKRLRALSDSLGKLSSNTPKTYGEMYTAIGQALGEKIAGKRADTAERAGQAEADGLWGKIWGGALGGSQPGVTQSSAGSPSPYVAKQTPQDAIGDDAMRALGLRRG